MGRVEVNQFTKEQTPDGVEPAMQNNFIILSEISMDEPLRLLPKPPCQKPKKNIFRNLFPKVEDNSFLNVRNNMYQEKKKKSLIKRNKIKAEC